MTGDSATSPSATGEHAINGHAFSEEERRGVYRAIFERRDVRSQFLPEPVPLPLLARLLAAAHHAPSVGYSQPWDFILIEDLALRRAVKEMFATENERAARNYDGERAQLYRSLKLEGILEAPLNLCVTCHRGRGGPHVLGRNTMIETDLFSTCLAVQNLWLAARAEGVGIGWVSIVEPSELGRMLQLPEGVYPLAYLCIGFVSEFKPKPDLERQGWRNRLQLGPLLHHNLWAQPYPELSRLIEAVE